MRTQVKPCPFKFKNGQLVAPVPECKDEICFKVLGPSVFVEQWWTPILDPREDDPTFFKTSLLESWNTRKRGKEKNNV